MWQINGSFFIQRILEFWVDTIQLDMVEEVSNAREKPEQWRVVNSRGMQFCRTGTELSIDRGMGENHGRRTIIIIIMTHY